MPISETHMFRHLPVPRDPAIPTIRILTLCPGSGAQPLEFTLENMSLEGAESYEALSYAWGKVTPEHMALYNGATLLITKNLDVALRNFRSPDRPRNLWIDAICINQEDSDEKSHQINLMCKIFQYASRVLVWLGEADGKTEMAMSYAEELAREAENRTVYKAPPGKLDPVDQKGNALKALLKRSWFGRIWVIQEVSVNQNVMVYCGDFNIEWDKLKEASTSIEKFTRTTYHTLFLHRDDFLNYAQKDLASLVVLHQDFAASQPEDKIFALHGLAKIESTPLLQINYNLSSGQVYFEWFVTCLRAHHNLDILGCAPPVGSVRSESVSNLPSWIPDWSVPRTTYSLTYAKEFCDWVPRFAASADTKYIPGVSADGKSLSLCGHRVDQLVDFATCLSEEAGVAEIGEASQAPSHTLHWLNRYTDGLLWHLSWESLSGVRKTQEYKTGEKIVDVYWQTILGGCNDGKRGEIQKEFEEWDKDMQNISFLHRLHLASSRPVIFFLITGFFFRRRCLHKFPNTGLSKIPEDSAWKFKDRFIFTKGRTMAATTEKRIGLVPASAKKGDQVWILEGGKVPFVLRPSEIDGVWFFVGEAYIHDIMHGEAYNESKCISIQLR